MSAQPLQRPELVVTFLYRDGKTEVRTTNHWEEAVEWQELAEDDGEDTLVFINETFLNKA